MKIRKYNEAWGARAPYGDAEDQRIRDKERAEYDKLGRKHNRDEFYDYVKSCFINIIERAESYGLDDESIYEITEEDNEYGHKPSMALFIDLRPPSQVTKIKEITPPFTNNDSENVIKRMIEYNNYVNETYEEVLSCLTLVKQQYPNCSYQIETGDTEIDKINKNINFTYIYWQLITFYLEK